MFGITSPQKISPSQRSRDEKVLDLSWAQSSDWCCYNSKRGMLFSHTQSCPTLCSPLDCSPPDTFVHGIFQARILEWVSVSFSRGSFQPRMEPTSPALAGRFFTPEPPGKTQARRHEGEVMWWQMEVAWHCLKPRNARSLEGARTDSSPPTSEGWGPADTLISDC